MNRANSLKRIKSAEISVIYNNNFPSVEYTQSFESNNNSSDDKIKNKEKQMMKLDNDKNEQPEPEVKLNSSGEKNQQKTTKGAEENSILIKENVSDELLITNSIMNSSSNLHPLKNDIKIPKNILLIDSYKKFEKVLIH
jgi:hypothetical protein